jgi:hypothetical protein
MLAGLKALLEHSVAPNFVADHYPDDQKESGAKQPLLRRAFCTAVEPGR